MRLLAVLALILPSLAIAAPGSAASYVPINGSGSSYEYPPINQWDADLVAKGLAVSYNPDGSAAGQEAYIANQADFAGSDPPFRTSPDKLAGLGPQVVPWGFSYIPAVATGIAFIYHISAQGHVVRNLRLSGQTLLGIFTGRITNWDNPQITRDYGSRLPDLPITPVIHTEIAGLSYYFTRWLAHEFAGQWNAFCDRVHPGIQPPCGPTEIYPRFGHAKRENGSANVTAYVSSQAGNGAIGYVETGYALAYDLPMLALRNPAGKYVRPTAANVTTALTAARINNDPRSPDFLQENLDPVYVYTNPRSYPLSSYSYLIVPRIGTKLPPAFTNAKGQTLSAFISYALCAGQSQLPAFGIAPLPANLVAAGLQQVKNIPGHGPVPSPARCH